MTHASPPHAAPPRHSGRRLGRIVWTGLIVGTLGGLFLWWRYGMPVGLANAVWLCAY